MPNSYIRSLPTQQTCSEFLSPLCAKLFDAIGSLCDQEGHLFSHINPSHSKFLTDHTTVLGDHTRKTAWLMCWEQDARTKWRFLVVVFFAATMRAWTISGFFQSMLDFSLGALCICSCLICKAVCCHRRAITYIITMNPTSRETSDQKYH